MLQNQTQHILRERLKALIFAPQLKHVEREWHIREVSIDPHYEARDQVIRRPACVVESFSLLTAGKKELLTGRITLTLPYRDIHPDFYADNSLTRTRIKQNAQRIIKEICADYLGIKDVSVVQYEKSESLVLKIRAKDLARFEEEVQHGTRPMPTKAPNVTWLDRVREAYAQGCQDSSYWR